MKDRSHGYGQLTSSEMSTYQALVARGVSHDDALEDALDGVDVETARGLGPVTSGIVKPPAGSSRIARMAHNFGGGVGEPALRDNLIKVFQKSWHDADVGGNMPSGTRTGAGIDAVMEYLRQGGHLRKIYYFEAESEMTGRCPRCSTTDYQKNLVRSGCHFCGTKFGAEY